MRTISSDEASLLWWGQIAGTVLEKMKPNLFPPIYYPCFPFFHLKHKGPSNVNDCRNSKYFFSRIGILSCFSNCFGWNWLSFLTQSLFWKQLTQRILMVLRQFVCWTYCLLLYGESWWLKIGVFWLQLKMSLFTFLVEYTISLLSEPYSKNVINLVLKIKI